MPSYFQPPRRKFGILTLVVACVLAGFWVRSLIVLDYIDLHFGKHISFVLVIHRQYALIFAEYDPIVDLSLSPSKWVSSPTSSVAAEDLAEMTYSSVSTMIRYRNHPPIVPKGAIQPIKVPKLNPDHRLVGLPLHYWLAIPLALLSAWLLFSKPGVSTSFPNDKSENFPTPECGAARDGKTS